MRTDGADLFGTDGRYTTQAGDPGARRRAARRPRHGAGAGAARPSGGGAGRLGFESHDLTVDGLAALEKVLADAAAGGTVPELASVRRAVEAQRAIKDDDEIESLRRACAVADQALAELAAEGALRPGPHRAARSAASSTPGCCALGAEAPSFETIVAAGANSAIPHHRPDATVLRDGDFLKLDFGATVDGYHSDMTRTVVLGARRGLAARDLRAGRRRRRRPGGRRWRSVPTSSRSTRPPATSSPRPATASTSRTASGTASGWRSTRRRASARWARVPWLPAWPSPWSRASTCPAAAVSGSRTR